MDSPEITTPDGRIVPLQPILVYFQSRRSKLQQAVDRESESYKLLDEHSQSPRSLLERLTRYIDGPPDQPDADLLETWKQEIADMRSAVLELGSGNTQEAIDVLRYHIRLATARASLMPFGEDDSYARQGRQGAVRDGLETCDVLELLDPGAVERAREELMKLSERNIGPIG